MSMIGKSLAHYEIAGQIGKGGMGEVYQAKDTKLGREVAIKVLPQEFAKDAGRVARFQREAKLLASLNHPNIAALYGLEESDGINFLVMELVEGSTLDDRIRSGPIPVEETLKLALQIAEALEAAHEKGVIHRDLKPANIKVTPEGKVKVLDFGLAKAFDGEQADINLSNSPTLSQAATMQGVILGTAAYMSPEQARGKTVDKKTDVWAFGAVLYEMLTGKQAFQGEDISETLASVIKGDANQDLLPLNIHQRIREIVFRCLQKELRKRYPDIANARYEIERILEDPGGVFVQQAAAEPPARIRSVIPWIAAVVFVGLIAGVAAWCLRAPESRQITHFKHELSAGQQFSASDIPILAISPDGSHFVYSTNEGLYLRSMDESDARHLAGTDGNSRLPFFSPDGKWIGYVSGSESPMKLKKIAVHEGTPMTLCEVPSIAGGFSWSSDKGILHAVGNRIMRTSDDGGEWEPLIEENINSILGYPQMLPGGEAVIFLNASVSPHKIVVRSLKSGKSKELLEGYSPRYIKTGHIVYGAEDNLYVVPFDIDTLKLTGDRNPVIKDVSSSMYNYDYDVSDSGTLVYLPSMFNQRIFTWVDREGREEPLAAASNLYQDLRISPDGKQVATSYFDDRGNEDIWIYDLVGGKFSRTTFFEGDDYNPIWTADGKRIIYSSESEDGRGIYSRAANGTGDTKTLHFEQGHALTPIPWSLSQNGDILAITNLSADMSNSDIGTASLGDDTVVRKMLLTENYLETQPQISPNGKWMAYTSDQTGKSEVYVCTFPNVNEWNEPVSTNGGYSPIWSPNGGELFYRTDNEIMAVTVKGSTTFKFEKPIKLFPDSYVKGNLVNGSYWDISPDGNRFLMLKNIVSEPNNPIEINIVLNWFEELKEKVPVP